MSVVYDVACGTLTPPGTAPRAGPRVPPGGMVNRPRRGVGPHGAARGNRVAVSSGARLPDGASASRSSTVAAGRRMLEIPIPTNRCSRSAAHCRAIACCGSAHPSWAPGQPMRFLRCLARSCAGRAGAGRPLPTTFAYFGWNVLTVGAWIAIADHRSTYGADSLPDEGAVAAFRRSPGRKRVRARTRPMAGTTVRDERTGGDVLSRTSTSRAGVARSRCPESSPNPPAIRRAGSAAPPSQTTDQLR